MPVVRSYTRTTASGKAIQVRSFSRSDKARLSTALHMKRLVKLHERIVKLHAKRGGLRRAVEGKIQKAVTANVRKIKAAHKITGAPIFRATKKFKVVKTYSPHYKSGSRGRRVYAL